MPGISVPLDHFLARIGSDSLPGFNRADTKSKPLPFQLGGRKIRRVTPDRGPMP
jgi:hypothetical protein